MLPRLVDWERRLLRLGVWTSPKITWHTNQSKICIELTWVLTPPGAALKPPQPRVSSTVQDVFTEIFI